MKCSRFVKTCLEAPGHSLQRLKQIVTIGQGRGGGEVAGRKIGRQQPVQEDGGTGEEYT